MTTGAENDFQVATRLARKMVTRWGMSEHIGLMFVEEKAGAPASPLSLHPPQGMRLPRTAGRSSLMKPGSFCSTEATCPPLKTDLRQ